MSQLGRHVATYAAASIDSAATREIVDEFLFRLGIGDLEGVSRLFADDIEWLLSWPAEQLDGPIPWIRDRRTPADVVAHFASIVQHNVPDDPGTSVDAVVVDGMDAVILGIMRNRIRRTGRAYEARFALHLTVEDRLIRRYSIHEDSLAVALAWFG
jgi:ketosteroid isomerase-like protein